MTDAGVANRSLFSVVRTRLQLGESPADIRRDLKEADINHKTLDTYLNSLGAGEGSNEAFWHRGRIAGVMHLVDLKRAGHSPRITERGWVDRPVIAAPPAPLLPPSRAPASAKRNPEPLSSSGQLNAHVLAWRRFSIGLARREPPVPLIVAAAARHFGVSADEINSSSRPARLVRPRQIAMFLANKLTTSSLPQIARLMGGRDHTTVLHGIRKTESLKHRPDYASAIAAIRTDIEANFCRKESDHVHLDG